MQNTMREIIVFTYFVLWTSTRVWSVWIFLSCALRRLLFFAFNVFFLFLLWTTVCFRTYILGFFPFFLSLLSKLVAVTVGGGLLGPLIDSCTVGCPMTQGLILVFFFLPCPWQLMCLFLLLFFFCSKQCSRLSYRYLARNRIKYCLIDWISINCEIRLRLDSWA